MDRLLKPLPFEGLWEPTLLTGEDREWPLLVEEFKDLFYRGYRFFHGKDSSPHFRWRWLHETIEELKSRPPARERVVRKEAPRSGEVTLIFPHGAKIPGVDPPGAWRGYLVYWPPEEGLAFHLLLEWTWAEGWRAWVAWRALHADGYERKKRLLPFCTPSEENPYRVALGEPVFCPWGYHALGRDAPIWELFLDLASKAREQHRSLFPHGLPPDTLSFSPFGFGLHLVARKDKDLPYRAFFWLEEEGLFLPLEDFLPFHKVHSLPIYPLGLDGEVGGNDPLYLARHNLVLLHHIEPFIFEKFRKAGLGGEEDFSSLHHFRRAKAFLLGKDLPPLPTPEETLLAEGFSVPDGLIDAVLLLPGVVAVLREFPWGKKAFLFVRNGEGKSFSALFPVPFWVERAWTRKTRPSWKELIKELGEFLRFEPSFFYMPQNLPAVHERIKEIATQHA